MMVVWLLIIFYMIYFGTPVSNTEVYNKAASEDMEAKVATIRIVGSSALAGESIDHSDYDPYHWRFYLLLKPGEGKNPAISFDMVPGGDGQTGALIVTSRDSEWSKSADSFTYDIEAKGGLTPAAFLDQYVQRGRHRFRFNEQGKGCRLHTLIVLRDMEEVGYAASDGSTQFEEWIAFLATEVSNMISEWVEGLYY